MKGHTIADGSEIYWDGLQYDAFNRPQSDDLPFYLAAARRARGPVLELACGTGRLTIPLARAGLDVTGLDAAAPMLALAGRKAAAAGARVQFVKGDARRFRLGRRFKLVFLAFNSLQHFGRPEDLAGLFASVRRHLAPGGRFVFDVPNPDPRYLVRDPDELLPVAYYDDPSGKGKVLVNERFSYDKKTQTVRLAWHYRSERTGRTLKKTLNLRCFFPEELLALVRCNGFRVLARYGDLDRGPFRSDSPGRCWPALPYCKASGRFAIINLL